MNIYRISQDQNNGYDTFDSAVVVANTEEEARKISPGGRWYTVYSDWCMTPDDVKVELIGTTDKVFKNPVICASFNAG